MPTQKYPEPTVGALIFNDEGKLLLVQTHKWRDRYTIPGGHIELGERIEDAIRREVKEETNLAIRDVKFLCYQNFIYDDAFWKKRHFVFLDFTCRADSREVVLNDEAQSYIWATLDEALKLPIDQYTKYAIHKTLNGNTVI